MKEITAGDTMHVYGSFGLKMDYTVRLCIRMKDEVNAEMLSLALKDTEKRYPYLSLRMKKDASRLFSEENPEPVVLLHTDRKISLNASETNYHVWAVCYNEDMIYLDIYHGLLDGTGMYMVLSTLLYGYCSRRYGVTDHTGVRTLEDDIRPEEMIDPWDHLPDIDLTKIPTPNFKPAFSLLHDAGLPQDELEVIDLIIPEADFLKFTSANDASPGTMISLLFARTIDELYPEREKGIMSSYVINGRPMLNASMDHHNCVHTVFMDYSDRIKAVPFDRQCTVYRGKTFVQSDADRVAGAMTVNACRNRMIAKSIPTVEGKMETFAKMLSGGRMLFTFMVSYVGKWKYKAVEPYISEFWTHVPPANSCLSEIAAVGGNIFLSVHQQFRDDTILQSFIRELKSNGVDCMMKKRLTADIPHFVMPE